MLKTKSIVSVAVASLILVGCSSTQPGLVENKSYDNAKSGALIGALSGAIIGYQTRDKNKGKGAIVGGLLGAAAGGAVGYSIDRQANEVARALGTGVENDPLAALDPRRDIIVSKTENYVKIIFRDDMMFATNSAVLQPTAKDKVGKVASLLENYPQTVVGVAGFTDNRGSYQYNLNLSEKRAATVAGQLAVNGYPATKGCSYNKPIAANDSPANRALNRRVEVYLYGNQNMMNDPCQ